jgi:co-chaperonin GroES (HSP10)
MTKVKGDSKILGLDGKSVRDAKTNPITIKGNVDDCPIPSIALSMNYLLISVPQINDFSPGGIEIPKEEQDAMREKAVKEFEGHKILLVGPEVDTTKYAVGERVITAGMRGFPTEIKGYKYLFVREQDLMYKLVEKKAKKK